MLDDDVKVVIDGETKCFDFSICTAQDLPATLQFWMAYVARDLLYLGAFFRAAGILLQIPGAAQYERVHYEDDDDEEPDEDLDPCNRLKHAKAYTVFSVLAECLKRLAVASLIEQIPDADQYTPVDLSKDWTEYLDEHAKLENGLLTVVTECLNRLIVSPTRIELDNEPEPAWWQRLWAGL